MKICVCVCVCVCVCGATAWNLRVKVYAGGPGVPSGTMRSRGLTGPGRGGGYLDTFYIFDAKIHTFSLLLDVVTFKWNRG